MSLKRAFFNRYNELRPWCVLVPVVVIGLTLLWTAVYFGEKVTCERTYNPMGVQVHYDMWAGCMVQVSNGSEYYMPEDLWRKAIVPDRHHVELDGNQ